MKEHKRNLTRGMSQERTPKRIEKLRRIAQYKRNFGGAKSRTHRQKYSVK